MSSGAGNRYGTMSSVHLDAIRGAAALVVLLGHTRDLFFSSLTAAFSTHETVAAASPFRHVTSSVSIGNEAVIVFFVLSGYLVGGSAIRDIRNQRWSWKKYLIQRSTRLWIVLLPALLLGVALDHLGLQLLAGPHSIYSCPSGQTLVPCNVAQRLSPRVVAANVFFLQTILVDTAGTNNALWSLANEFWYYLAFPMCLLAFQPAESKSRRALYTVALLILGAFVGRHISLLFFVWLLGALIYVLPLKIPRKTLSVARYLLPVLFPLSILLVRQSHLPRYPAQWAVALSFSVLLYVVLHSNSPARAGVYKTVAGFFSRMSYSLYLVHLPVAVLLCACMNAPWQPWDKSPLHLAAFLLLNLVLVAFAYLFYRAFEANTDVIRHAIFDPQPRPHTAGRGIPDIDVSIG
jgi:peptidoglycan/LPS O-acetylase OafA/YrhL